MSEPKPITYKGKTQSASKWAREMNISSTTIRRRLNEGMPLDEVFKPTNYRRI